MVSSDKQNLLGRSTPRNRCYVLVIHGGAGNMSKEDSTPGQRAAYKAALSKALISVS